jgi:hydrogenase nickel incorporation protein HypB
MTKIVLKSNVMKKNDACAQHNRDHFDDLGLFCVNMIGSPGGGKTTLLEATFRRYGEDSRFAVIEGDVKTDYDMQRIASVGVPAVQIETDGSCHLNAVQVQEMFGKLDLPDKDVLIIENVGNLICPVSYDLGEHRRMIVISVTEGADKPLKYPSAFTSADIMVITKVDLSPYVEVDPEELKANGLKINPGLKVIISSAKTGEGISDFYEALKGREAESLIANECCG